MTGLVDTNILVYRFDPRYPVKQAAATDFLRDGAADESLVVPHQALIEFVSVVTTRIAGGASLLTLEEAHREVDAMLTQFRVIYPSEQTLRTALKGAARYRISWFDAHLWAYAEDRGIRTLWSEDLEHGRLYGNVKVLDPFASPSMTCRGVGSCAKASMAQAIPS
jgi:predicted nucleic acid-binding protein